MAEKARQPGGRPSPGGASFGDFKITEDSGEIG